jgi:hypothetical protein
MEYQRKDTPQVSATSAVDLERQNQHSAREWEKLQPTPFNRLKLCEALWARYTVVPDYDIFEKMDWLKGVIAMHIRAADPKEVLGDPGLRTMVWCFFGEGGVERLKAKTAN